MSYVYDTGWTWYDPDLNHPFTTSTGCEGGCETCGNRADCILHNKPYGPSLPVFGISAWPHDNEVDPTINRHKFQTTPGSILCSICNLDPTFDIHTPVLDSRSQARYNGPMTTDAHQAFEDAIAALGAVISDTENVIAPQHITKMRQAFYAMRMVQQYGMEPR